MKHAFQLYCWIKGDQSFFAQQNISARIISYYYAEKDFFFIYAISSVYKGCSCIFGLFIHARNAAAECLESISHFRADAIDSHCRCYTSTPAPPVSLVSQRLPRYVQIVLPIECTTGQS